MKEFISLVKETIQYVCIVATACLSALWLLITGKKHHKD